MIHVKARSLLEEKSLRIILTIVVTWLIVKLPIWVGLFDLSAPWDEISADVVAVIVAILRAVFLTGSDPSVPVKELPSALVSVTNKAGDPVEVDGRRVA